MLITIHTSWTCRRRLSNLPPFQLRHHVCLDLVPHRSHGISIAIIFFLTCGRDRHLHDWLLDVMLIYSEVTFAATCCRYPADLQPDDPSDGCGPVGHRVQDLRNNWQIKCTRMAWSTKAIHRPKVTLTSQRFVNACSTLKYLCHHIFNTHVRWDETIQLTLMASMSAKASWSHSWLSNSCDACNYKQCHQHETDG